ncbi:helix-hairpin-helix domain-containing protein [Gilliamella sp. ESL0405]|uniref:ComEA family DNA-binding protein n=1 Tax=Gilliamella sp. ESL0405 TaxID=2704653 RepID=UPI001C6A26E4|nr:helix-hairpin-helix domain-containing protein [Gilliamella sp. ESL0405]QYN47520.1 helix-hairpin-helix domain-containing protein [Gilliamella sp. ESL0405]
MKLLSILSLLLLSFTFSGFSYAQSASPATAQQQQKQLDQVNINTATAEELTKALNGIGANKAQKIVEYREKFGPFVSIEQLKEVSGIGQAILDKNAGKITL